MCAAVAPDECVTDDSVASYLRGADVRHHGDKKAWSWHAGERYYKKSKRKLSMDELRNLYGSEDVTPHRSERASRRERV